MENPGPISQPLVTPVSHEMMENKISAYMPTESYPVNSAEAMQIIPSQNYAVQGLNHMPRYVYSPIIPNQPAFVVSKGKNVMLQSFMPPSNNMSIRNMNLCGSCRGRRRSLSTVSNPRSKYVGELAETSTQTDAAVIDNIFINYENQQFIKQKVTSEAQTVKSFSQMKSAYFPEVSTFLSNYKDLENDDNQNKTEIRDDKFLKTSCKSTTKESESQQCIRSNLFLSSSSFDTPPPNLSFLNGSISESEIDNVNSMPPSLEPMEDVECSTQQSISKPSSDCSLTSVKYGDEINSLSPPSLEPMIEPTSPSTIALTALPEAKCSLPQTSNKHISESTEEKQPSEITEIKSPLCPLQFPKMSISPEQDNTLTEMDSNRPQPRIVRQSLRQKEKKNLQKAFIKPQRLILPADLKGKNVILIPVNENLPLQTIDLNETKEKYHYAEMTELENSPPKSKTRKKRKTGKNSHANTPDSIGIKISNDVVNSSSEMEVLSESAISADKDIEIIEVVNKKEPITLFQNDPSKWNVQDVSEFLDSTGYSDCVDKFQFNEIDGEVLLMLELHHLMDMMDMKLGSALKLLSIIKSLKEKFDEKSPGKEQELL